MIDVLITLQRSFLYLRLEQMQQNRCFEINDESNRNLGLLSPFKSKVQSVEDLVIYICLNVQIS